jgi:hypothetical protein
MIPGGRVTLVTFEIVNARDVGPFPVTEESLGGDEDVGVFIAFFAAMSDANLPFSGVFLPGEVYDTGIKLNVSTETPFRDGAFHVL